MGGKLAQTFRATPGGHQDQRPAEDTSPESLRCITWTESCSRPPRAQRGRRLEGGRLWPDSPVGNPCLKELLHSGVHPGK